MNIPHKRKVGIRKKGISYMVSSIWHFISRFIAKYYIQNTKYKKLRLILLLLSLTLLGAFVLKLTMTEDTQAGWYNDNWSYRTKITFGNTGAADSDKKVKFDIDTATLIAAGKLKSNCGDSRFTDINGVILQYYLDSANGACNTNSTDYYVLIPSIPNGTNTIYHYYGNPNAMSGTQSSQFSQSTFSPNSGPSIGTEEQSPAPALYLKLDEGQGSVAYDSSTNKMNGSLGTGSNAPTWKTRDECLNEACLNFDGSNDFVSIGSTAPTIQSVSFWVKPNTTTEKFVELSGAANISATSGTVSTTGITSPTIYVNGKVSSTITANQWSHVMVTTGTAITASNIKIGRVSSTSLSGSLDEVKMYSYARSAAEVKQDYVSRGSVSGVSAQLGESDMLSKLQEGLVGWWKVDENTGTSASDASGAGNTGTLGTGSSAPTWAGAKFGTGLTFDGSNDYVTVAVSSGGISFTNLGASSGTATNPDIRTTPDASSYSNTSWTPPTTGIIVAFVDNSLANCGNIPTMSGNSLTWTQIQTVCVDPGQSDRITLFAADASGATTGATTIDYNAETQLNTDVSFFQVTGADISGGIAGAFVQTPTSSGTATSGSITLAAAGSSNNRPIAAFYHKANEATSPDASWSEIDDMNHAGPTAGIETQWDTDGFQDASASWTTSSAWIGIAAELKAATGSTPPLLSTVLTNFTIGGWIKPATSIASKALVVSDNEIRLVTDASGNPVCQIHNGTAWQTAATSTIALSLGTWQHVVCTYDQQNLKIFVNGIQTASQALTESVNNTSNSWDFGRDSGGTYGAYNGTMDDIRVYNRPLTPSEAQALYNFGPAPAGYWKLDDNQGTTAIDVSSNSNTGTLTNGPTWTGGKYGSAVTFDGVNDYIETASSVLNPSSQDVSVSGWFKMTTINGDDNTIVGQKDGTGTGRIWLGVSSTGKLISFFGGARRSGNTTLVTNTWYHGMVTLSGLTLKLYLNGVLDGTFSLSSVESATGALRFGISKNDAQFFTGPLDDVKIYNYARTPGQIIEDMNGGHPLVGSPVGSAVAYWKLDGMTGTNAEDGSINGNDLTLNSASWTTSGKYGNAWNGTGSNWLSRADDSDLDIGSSEPFTLSMWTKSDSASNPGASEFLMTKQAATNNPGYRMYFNTSGQVVCDSDDDTSSYPEDSATTTTDYYDNLWHNVICIRDIALDKLTVYIDGTQAAQDTDVSAIGDLSNSSTFYVGDDDADSTNSFAGDIDEVKVYRAALTSDQVKVERNAGKAIVMGALSTNSSGVSQTGQDWLYCPPGSASSCTGPVGEWRLNENNGPTVYDTSGNNLTGTIATISPTWIAGKNGSAIDFSGVDPGVNADGIIVVQDNNVLDVTTTLTFEAWIYPKRINSFDEILSKIPAAYGSGYEFMNSNGTLRTTLRTGGGNCDYVAGTLTANTWQHVVSTYDGTNTRHYINGILQGTSLNCTFGAEANTERFMIAQRYSEGRFKGGIDEVKVYNYVRTPAQIAWTYNKGEPVAWYRFDECQGTIANNSAPDPNGSDSGNDGTITPTTLDNTAAGTCNSGTTTEMWNDGTTGKINASLGFDGDDDYVQVTDTSSLRFDTATEDFSLFAWVKRGANGAMYIISKEDADNDGWRLQFDSGNTVTCSEDSTDVTSSTTITDTNWHFVGCTISRGGNGQVYIDGKADGASVAMGSDAMATTANIRIGTRAYTSTNYLDGQIDDLRIFNYALTAQQVRDVYNNGAVSFK